MDGAKALGEQPQEMDQGAISDVSVLRSDADLIVATFDQDYRSSDLSQRIRKRQYWIRESGRWKIAGPAGGARLARVVSRESAALKATVPGRRRLQRRRAFGETAHDFPMHEIAGGRLRSCSPAVTKA